MCSSDLETRGALDDHATLVVGDPATLWSNERILRHLNAAQRIFARKAWVIVDDTTAACCDIQLLVNQPDYALHASVLGVLSVRLSDSDRALARKSWKQVYGAPVPESDWFDTSVPATFAAGRPSLFSTDTATRKITFWRKPDATAAALLAKLRVARLPIASLTLDSTPEIPEEYHLDLCDYATGRLLKNTANNDTGEAQGEARRIGRSLLEDFDRAVSDAERDVKRRNQIIPAWQLGGWVDGE